MSVVLPIYNEEDVIVEILQDLIYHIGDPLEIIIVDDDSQDRSRDIINNMNDSRIVLIHRTHTSGLASAILRGVIESKGDIVTWLDADAWMMPPLIPLMIENLSSNDAVVASRYVAGGGDKRTFTRVFTSRMINGWAQLCLGREFKDYTSNFIVLHRPFFNYAVPSPVGFGEFFIDLIYSGKCNGAAVLEYPYVLQDRKHGSSKASANFGRFLKLGFRYFLFVIFIRLRDIGKS